MSYLWKQPPSASDIVSDLGPRFEALALQEATRATAGSDLQTLWLDTYTRLAHTDEALERLRESLDGTPMIRGAVMEQDRRWLVIARLNAFGWPDAHDIAQKELERDPSDSGVRMFILSRASRPSAQSKREWLDQIRDPHAELSLKRRRSAIAGLFPRNQWKLHAEFAEEILTSLNEVAETQQDAFLSSYTSLIPRLCRPESVDRLSRAISENPGMHPILMKDLRIAHQEDARCLAISRLFTGEREAEGG